ncbi:glutamine amidotransferase [Aquabacter spiritensis]|uniref:GMP synthase (Glutamine-hydrolysing) n=1 Tax=Aquabacter spiritensis TaxID=933073 RepID=A0A4R3LTQ2_9HYPH|nr:GMP synthase (glutamine-hydrolysing) [Aquabacter spiritensis]
MDRETIDEIRDDIEPGSPAAAGRILVIMHQAHSVPGRIGQRLEARGFELDPCRPAIGDPLPKSLSGHDGVIVFGGPMSANDPSPFIREEIEFVGRVMAQDKPLLGVCLGAQLMATQLGARVSQHAEGLCEMGYYPVRPTPLGQSLLPWPSHVYHWHSEGFDLPAGAELLAEGDVFPNQAFRYGRHAYALQFHPEVTQEMMCRWTVRGAERLKRPGAQPAEAHFSGWSQYDPAVCHWLDRFLDAWVGLTVADTKG